MQGHEIRPGYALVRLSDLATPRPAVASQIPACAASQRTHGPGRALPSPC